MLEESLTATTPPHQPWTLWQRVAFRFAFCFWILWDNGLSLVLGVWPWLNGHIESWLAWPFERFAVWAAVTIFHLHGEATTAHPSGSGDKALDWVTAACNLALAALLCAVWSIISEVRSRRREYHTLYAWLRLVLRFTLASALLNYGFIKVFPLQMPPPSPESLKETYGASSPMHLAWTFIGASTIYRIFAGFCEAIPGILLLFRRTSTLGAMGAAAVMLNVFMMNMGYDIPVKLYSFELLLAALFLLLPDAAPLWRFFAKRQPAMLTGVWVRRSERKPIRIAALCLQILVIAQIAHDSAWGSWNRWHDGQTEIHGYWAVDSISGIPNEVRWTSVAALYAGYLQVHIENDPQPMWLTVTTLTKQRELQFFVQGKDDASAGKPYADLHWQQNGADKMTLTGTWLSQPATVTLHRMPPPDFPLTSRGFHWVQEYPYNR